MPSDLPPNQPQQQGSPGTGAAETGEGREARADAASRTAGDRMASSTGTSSADVRRYAGMGGGEQKQSSAVSNSFALAMIVAFVVVAFVMIRQGPKLVQSQRVLPGAATVAPGATGTGNTTPTPAARAVSAAPSIDPNSVLARAYGMNALNSASRQARRVGQAVAVAAECGVRTAYWANEVREVIAKAQTERYPSFEDNARTREMLKRFIAQEFIIGQRSTGSVFAERGKQAACDDIRYSPDYRTAVTAGEQAGIR